MQPIKKVCLKCSRVFTLQRNPVQQYCEQRACQQARRNEWRRQKKSADADYRANQQAANRRWQEQRRDYWRWYRSTHPDYTRRNREQQRQRDQCQTAQTTRLPHLAKRDAFSENASVSSDHSPLLSGTYDIVPVVMQEQADLAKRDALRVKITLISMK
jgi:hypothetical protein